VCWWCRGTHLMDWFDLLNAEEDTPLSILAALGEDTDRLREVNLSEFILNTFLLNGSESESDRISPEPPGEGHTLPDTEG
jgi:hypothetical protein